MNDTARIACGEYAWWNISSDDASGADNGSCSDAHTGKNHRTATDPNVRTNLNWLPILLPAA
jgi:hypothetical protein